jgi:AraC-like DNA-binding protein
MRDVIISDVVQQIIDELEFYLLDELKLSEEAALKRSQLMRKFVASLGNPVDYALCRFKQWRALGYRCAVFEGWVFAYEIVDGGVIVRNMAYGSSLTV